MSRRKESLFETVMSLPWWVGITVAVVGYLGIGFAIPAYLKKGSPLFSKVDLNGIAWIWFGIFVCAAAMSFVRSLIVRRKFDSISSIRDLSWSQFEVMVGEAFRRQGYVVTSGDFTTEAREFANATAIELIDGTRLNRMFAAVKTDAPGLHRAEPQIFNESESTASSCPRCGSQMVKRTAKQGKNAGSQFWGCSTYPKCKETRDLC